jgi:hypothetical protein
MFCAEIAMKSLSNILRRLLRRQAKPTAPAPVIRTVTADEHTHHSVYLVRTRKGIVVLY